MNASITPNIPPVIIIIDGGKTLAFNSIEEAETYLMAVATVPPAGESSG